MSKKLILTLVCVMMAVAASAQLPAFKLKNLEGKTVSTENIGNDGKPTIISFFATYCKPCIRELGAISEVYADWQEETGVNLIAVSIDMAQNVKKVKPLVDREGWEYEVLLDSNSDFARAMGVQMVPHVFIIDGKGNIVESRSGYTEGSESHLIEKVKEIIAKDEK